MEWSMYPIIDGVFPSEDRVPRIFVRLYDMLELKTRKTIAAMAPTETLAQILSLSSKVEHEVSHIYYNKHIIYVLL